MGYRPPTFPWLVVAEGSAENPPQVELDRSNQAVAGSWEPLLANPFRLPKTVLPDLVSQESGTAMAGFSEDESQRPDVGAA